MSFRRLATRVTLQPLFVFGLAYFIASATAMAQSASDSCSNCHADLIRGFAGTPHGKASPEHVAGIACESCHGDGRAHADSNGDAAQIQNPAKLPAKDASARCLTCHSARHPAFAQSAHATSGIACTSCHSIHASKEGKLLKASQPALCEQCHAGVKDDFSQPIHHKLDGQTVTCTSCHNPHGTANSRLQATIAAQVSTCFKCHTELAGPWVYEHKAIRQAGCMACHSPHGGKNPGLLMMARVNTVCLECHLPSSTVGDAEVNAAHTPASTKPCTACHASIHGSNHESRFINP